MTNQFQQELQGRWPHMQHLEKRSKVAYDDTKQIELPESCPICKGKVMKIKEMNRHLETVTVERDRAVELLNAASQALSICKCGSCYGCNLLREIISFITHPKEQPQ